MSALASPLAGLVAAALLLLVGWRAGARGRAPFRERPRAEADHLRIVEGGRAVRAPAETARRRSARQ